MKVSLVLCTIGRVAELERFCEHLKQQTHQDFELIVVDQNADDRLVSLLGRYGRAFSIRHVQHQPGLSKARNVGLGYISGDIVAFPDDDCWYANALLEEVVNFFATHPEYAGLTGQIVDELGQPAVGRWRNQPGDINRVNVWNSATSASLFFRAAVVRQVGGFDESLGAGAPTPWGAGEDIDYPLRVLKLGYSIFYNPELKIMHPQILIPLDRNGHLRTRRYARGAGRVLRKHHYPFWAVAYHWLRPFGGVVLSLCTGRIGKAQHHMNIFLGRIQGWLAKP